MREVEVAFSTRSQSIPFRITKYSMLGVLIYFLWGSRYLWPTLIALLILSIAGHLWFRWKTRGWTQSYGPWKYQQRTDGDKAT